ncbi:MAG TPA: sigma-54 dependent transcriptional regulator [Luteibaculaceae bacterium]|nr:sigma-54 dependent transcriptional regulator [Luteibaculaceae bacterium]
MAKILIIDDERPIRNALKEIIAYEGHQVELAENGKEGLDMLSAESFDVCFCDIKMPLIDGHEVLKTALEREIETAFIMISGHANIETAVDAIKQGAYDFIEKPLELNRILVSLKNALKRNELEVETKILRQKVRKDRGSAIVGNSAALNACLDMVDKVAPTDARVLITGPNGSGKELIARRIHEKSQRTKGPFVEVNCAAIPSELIESELFGHEKGAFTSAIKTKKGRFEQAENGTIFLDEIGDMTLSAQAKVLRALQENKITRVGGESDIKINVRVIAATNKDLRNEITNGQFREDLFHRLSVIVVNLPSLNDRKEDIPLLAEHFNKQICEEYGIPPRQFSDSALEALQAVNWTGNIRELRNIIERLIILCPDQIQANHVTQYANQK